MNRRKFLKATMGALVAAPMAALGVKEVAGGYKTDFEFLYGFGDVRGRGNMMTLSELAERQGVDGDITSIVDALVKPNPILDDATWLEGGK